MKELISIHVGQAGVQVGNACWELFCLEHGVQPDGSVTSYDQRERESLATLFSMSYASKCTARAVYVDTDPLAINRVRTGATRELFASENLVSGGESGAQNFARGRYVLSDEVRDATLERIRKLAENCDDLQGFLFFGGVTGANGSGLGSKILEGLSEYEKTKFGFSIYPSPQTSTTATEHYNALLGTKQFKDHLDFSVILENQALHDICRSQIGINSPSFTHYNQLAAQVVNSLTASLRFGGELNRDLAELQANLLPFPSLKFLTSSYAPLMSKVSSHEASVDEITASAFDPASMLTKCSSVQESYMTCNLLYRGEVHLAQIESAVSAVKANSTLKFVNCCPTSLRSAVLHRPVVVVPGSEIGNGRRAVGMVSNNSSIKDVFERINSKFDLMFAKRAYAHFLVAEGMEEGDLFEAREEVALIESDYLSMSSRTNEEE
jgi:tubulin alpha